METTVAYVGTYTDTESEGIYRCQIDESTAELSEGLLVAEIDEPSFLAVDPDRQYLYAVNEIEDGAVTAYRISDDGSLEQLNQQVIGPADPCHCSVDATGNFLFVAHYIGGAVSVLPIADDGRVGEPTVTHHSGSSVHPDRQTAPHPHSIVPAPNNEFVYVPDLGTDEVVVYDLDRVDGQLKRRTSFSARDGAGPRHLEFGPGGSEAYLINELDSTVTVFDWDDESGELSEIDTVSTLPADYDGDNITADIHVHPSGSYVYGSNRGHDSIAVFEQTGTGLERLEIVETTGNWPRNFLVAPSGEALFVANARSNDIVGFELDPANGTTGGTVDRLSVPKPTCIRLV